MNETKIIAAVLAAGVMARNADPEYAALNRKRPGAKPNDADEQWAAQGVALYRACLRHLETPPE